MAGPKPMRTDFGIHQRLESCVYRRVFSKENGTFLCIFAIAADTGRFFTAWGLKLEEVINKVAIWVVEVALGSAADIPKAAITRVT